jgi:hypothetical protein
MELKPGTDIWYRKLDGTRVRGQVLGRYDGSEKWMHDFFLVALLDEHEPGIAVIPPARLETRNGEVARA